MTRILKIDSSARHEASLSRTLCDELATGLLEATGGTLVSRDLAGGVEFVDAAWVAANNTPPEKRDTAQRDRLSGSDALVDELEAMDTLIIGAPVYNFMVPAVLKAWIDQVCRARRTFAYTEQGPKGLLENKRAYLVFTSGGTTIGSDADMASPYLMRIMGFIGIRDVTVIAADRIMAQADEASAAARERIGTIVTDARSA